jgi:hypothetical protein
VGGRDVQWLLQHATSEEEAGGSGAEGRMGVRGSEGAVGARKQRQLTIFCATGAGSSLYLRALSGTFGCDIGLLRGGRGRRIRAARSGR